MDRIKLLALAGILVIGCGKEDIDDQMLYMPPLPAPVVVDVTPTPTQTNTPTDTTPEEDPCVDWVFHDGDYTQILEPYQVYYRNDLNPPAENVIAYGNGLDYIYNNAPSLIASELLVIPGVIRPGVYTPQASVEYGNQESTTCHPRWVLLNDHRLLYEHFTDQQRADSVAYVLTHEYMHIVHWYFYDTPADEELMDLYEAALEYLPSNAYWTTNYREFIAEVVASAHSEWNGEQGGLQAEPYRLYNELPGLKEWIETNLN